MSTEDRPSYRAGHLQSLCLEAMAAGREPHCLFAQRGHGRAAPAIGVVTDETAAMTRTRTQNCRMSLQTAWKTPRTCFHSYHKALTVNSVLPMLPVNSVTYLPGRSGPFR